MTIPASKIQFLADSVAELERRFDAMISEDVAASDGAFAKPSGYPTGGWHAHNVETGELIRGRKWKEGEMPRRFSTPEKAEAFGNKELAAKK